MAAWLLRRLSPRDSHVEVRPLPASLRAAPPPRVAFTAHTPLRQEHQVRHRERGVGVPPPPTSSRTTRSSREDRLSPTTLQLLPPPHRRESPVVAPPHTLARRKTSPRAKLLSPTTLLPLPPRRHRESLVIVLRPPLFNRTRAQLLAGQSSLMPLLQPLSPFLPLTAVRPRPP